METKRIEKELANVVARMIARDLQVEETAAGPVIRTTHDELAEAFLASIDYIDLGRAVIEALLTEETTDELLEGIRSRVKLPWYIPAGIVWGMLDKRLPEAVKGPLLDQLDRLEAGGNGGDQGVVR
jgi:hypothetical protein